MKNQILTHRQLIAYYDIQTTKQKKAEVNCWDLEAFS